VCDASAGEIVWGTIPVTGGSSIITIRRASANGTNARIITTFLYPSSGGFFDRGIALDETDKFFFHNSVQAGNDTLYYISTKNVNANSVPVATAPGYIDAVLANASIVLADDSYTQSSTTIDQIVSAPLPNGIISGSPPLFLSGQLYAGVVDETNFYGALWVASAGGGSVPGDTIIRCPLSGTCSSPAIVTRGQSLPSYFAADATAIYWTTGGQSTAIWKIAK
jgi:hypothetical protein